MKYAQSVLRQASETLKKSDAPTPARLRRISELFVRLDERDFSDTDLRSEFVLIKSALPPIESPSETGFSVMDSEKAKQLADRIHKLSGELENRG